MAFAAAIALAASPSAASAAAQAPTITWSTDILSRYVAVAPGNIVYDKPVVQTEWNFAFKNGVYLNLWISKSLDRAPPAGNFGNEIDYLIGWSGQIGALDVNLSAAYWDFSNPLLFQSRGDAIQLALELSKQFKFGDQTLTPYVKVEPTFFIGADAHGVYLHVGLRHRSPLADGIALIQSGRFVYDTGVFGATAGYNFRYDVALSFELSKNVALRLPTLRAFHPMTHFDDNRTNYLVYGVGIDVRF